MFAIDQVASVTNGNSEKQQAKILKAKNSKTDPLRAVCIALDLLPFLPFNPRPDMLTYEYLVKG